MGEEEIIFKVRIDVGETEKGIKELKTSLDSLKAANVENTTAIKNQEEALKKSKQATEAEDQSILKLRANSKELRAERDKLSTATVEGRKRIEELNKAIDANDIKIKANSTNLEKQRLNIGNYGDTFTQLSPKLGGVVNGIQGMTGAAKAFSATPMIAILALLSNIIPLIVDYFKNFEGALDLVEDVTTKVSAVFNSFIQNLDKVASIIGNVLIGNFSAAAQATGMLADEFGNAADEAQRLLDRTRDLEDAELKYRVSTAATANEMKALVVASKNRSLSIEESNALLQKASDLERNLTEKAVKIANERAAIEEARLVQSKKAIIEQNGLLRQADETQASYINRLIESGLFSPEQLDPLISAYERVEQEASAGLAFQEKIQNQQNALAEKKAEEDAKRRQKLIDENAKERIDFERLEQEKNQALIDAYEYRAQLDEAELQRSIAADLAAADQELAIADATQTKLQEFYDRTAERKRQADLKASNDAMLADQQRLQSAKAVFGGIGAIMTAFGVKSKGLNSALALANTFLGVTEILKAPAAPFIEPFASVVRFTQIATTLATGLGAVRQINSVSAAAGGGDFVTTKPTLLLVGDNPGARERVTVTPLSGKGKTTVSPNSGLIAMAGGGSITTGGFETAQVANQIESQRGFQQVVDAFAQMKIVLPIQDFEKVQDEKNQIEATATVFK